MLVTSALYKTRIKSMSREILPKVRIWFDGENAAYTEFDASGCASLSLLEEAQADGSNPLGSVSSNSLTITLRNDDRAFAPLYSNGTYYGRLHPNTMVEGFLGVGDASGNYIYVTLGKFYTGDWDAPASSVEATVTCYDKLYKYLSKDVPMIPTMEVQTRKRMFEVLFRALGLTAIDYSVDTTMTEIVPIGYYVDGTVADALAKMSSAFNCSVYVGRDNIIYVKSNAVVGSSVISLADSNMVFSTDVPQKTLEIYTDVEVKYGIPNIKDTESVLNITNLSVPAAGINIDYTKFNGPVAFVDYVSIADSQAMTIGDVKLGTWGMSMDIANDVNASMNIGIEVFGHPINTITDKVSARDASAYALIGEAKVLPIDNYLIQAQASAATFVAAILPIVSDPTAYVELSYRGDPSLEVNDVITVDNPSDKVSALDVVIIRHELTYNQGLSGSIRGIKKSART